MIQNPYGGHGVSDLLVSSSSAKKKEISWDNDEFLLKIHLKDMGIASRTVPLERKPSVGPYRSKMPCAFPSGVAICVPKKSVRNMKDDFNDIAPGINITISKKCLAKKLKTGVVIRNSSGDFNKEAEKRAVMVDIDVPYRKIFNVLRSKIDLVRFTFQNVLNK